MTVVEAMQGTAEPGAAAQGPATASSAAPVEADHEAAAAMARMLRTQQEALRLAAQSTREAGGQARTAARDQLREQIRSEVQTEIRNALRGGDVRPDQAGALAQQIAAQVADRAAAAADAANGRAFRIQKAGEPAVTGFIPDTQHIIPPQVPQMTYAVLGSIVLMVVFGPLTRAWARRMDRKTVAAPSGDGSRQLAQLQQSVEAIAIEVERISEAQRFTARMLGEGAAQPVEVARGERVGAR